MTTRFIRRIIPLFLAALMIVQPASPVTVRAEDVFQEKPMSGNSVEVTAKYKTQQASSKKTTKAFAASMAGTSIDLFRETSAAGDENSNILVSPDSVITVLAMLENGAGGKTRKEFKKALGGITASKYNRYLYGLHKRIGRSDKIRYETANSIWYKKNSAKFKKQFLKKVISYYQAEVYEAPFDGSTVNDVNNWAHNHTNGKISKILDRLSPEAKAIIMNAVYFKGGWAEPHTYTTKRYFTSSEGKKKKVPMLEGTEHVYLNIAGADGFVKYYKGGNTAFVALLPPKGTSVNAYINSLSGSEWIKGYRKRRNGGIDVRIRLPEFSYEYETSLKAPLIRMGIKQAFSGMADFEKMAVSDNPLYIDDIMHKTYINLNKDGTEAAAVTDVIMKNTSFVEPEKEIKKVYLNRPFVYAIIDTESGIPLFIGAVKKIK